jgi:hypothetical protein
MDNKELNRHKVIVMKSIFSNPKLARMFKEALSSPLGSTKRDNARSTLSIIGKLGKANDGMGGPGVSTSPQYSPSYANDNHPTYQPDYSNMMIFPAAPKFKAVGSTPTGLSKNGQGGPGDGRGGPLDLDPFGSMNFDSTPVTGANWTPTPSPTSAPTPTTAIPSPSTPVTGSNWNPAIPPSSTLYPSNPFSTPTPATPLSPQLTRTYTPGILGSTSQGSFGIPLGLEATLGAGLVGGAQWLGQNAAAAGERLGSGVVNALLGTNTYRDANGNIVDTNPIKPTPFTSFSDTWGGGKAADIINANWPSLSKGSPITPTTPTTPTSNPAIITAGNTLITPQNFKPDTTTGGTSGPIQTSGTNTGGNADTSGASLTFDNVFGASNPIGAYATDPNYIQKISTVFGQISGLGVAKTADALQQYITTQAPNSPITGQMIFDAANATGTDPTLLASVFQLESNFGTKGAATSTLNPGNQGNTGSATQTFSDWTSGVMATAQNLANRMSAVLGGSSTGTGSQTGSSSTPDLSTGAGIAAAAAQAVKSNMGPGTFALGVTNSVFGGGLQQALDKVNTDLKTQFGLTDLENQLTTLKNEKGNIIPTLQSYIQSKDQYLKVIDQMIANTQDSMSKMDMSNPMTASKMNDYMGYLVTLQNRQNQRYGNYLNSMITDYNNDVQGVQDNYTNMVNQYNTVMTSRDAITTEDYNNLYNSMSETYNQLDGAQAKIDNGVILHNNALSTQLDIVNKSNTLNNGVPTFKSSTEYLPLITDHTGGSNPVDVLQGSSIVDLATLYGTVVGQSGLSDSELTTHVTNLMNQGIKNGGISVANDYMKMIANLAQDPTYKVYAPQLAQGIQLSLEPKIKSTITSNAPEYTNAINDLVNPYGGFLGMGKAKSGVNDQAGWLAKYKTLDQDILNNLYQAVNVIASTNPTTYGQQPALIFTASYGDNTGNISKLSSDQLAQKVYELITANLSSQMNPSNTVTQTQQ